MFLQELPKNGNGKILKSKLRDIAKALVVDEDGIDSKKVQRSGVDHVNSRL